MVENKCRKSCIDSELTSSNQCFEANSHSRIQSIKDVRKGLWDFCLWKFLSTHEQTRKKQVSNRAKKSNDQHKSIKTSEKNHEVSTDHERLSNTF